MLSSGQTNWPSSSDLAAQIQELTDLIVREVPLNDLPRLTMQRVVKIFAPDIAAIYLRKEGGAFKLSASYPNPLFEDAIRCKKFSTWSVNEGAIGVSVHREEVVFVDDTKSAAMRGEYIPFTPDINSEAIIPIIAQDTFIGKPQIYATIVLSHNQRSFYGSVQRAVVYLVRSAVNAVFTAALARERTDKRIKFLRRISELNGNDIDQHFNGFLVALHELMGFRFASIWLYVHLRGVTRSGGDTFVIRSYWPDTIHKRKVTFASFDRHVLYADNCLTGTTLRDGKPRVIAGPVGERMFRNRNFAKRYRLNWLVSIPILDTDGTPLAALNMWPTGDPSTYDAEVLQLLSAYVAPLGTMIRFASLLSDRTVLSAYDSMFDRVLAFEDQQSQWDQLANAIRDMMGCEACSVFMISAATGRLSLKGTTGLEKLVPYEEVTYEPNEGMTGRCFAEAAPAIYYRELKSDYPSHISKHREALATAGPSRSIIFVPILGRDSKAIGVIRCNNKEESAARHVGRFTSTDLEVLAELAKLIASVFRGAQWMRERDVEREAGMNALHHELISPVAGMLSHASWLVNALDGEAAGRTFDRRNMRVKCEDIRQNGHLMAMLVTTLGRQDSDQQQSLDDVSLPAVANHCKAMLLHEAMRQKVRVDVGFFGTATLRAERLQMMRLFYNLLRNAIKYRDIYEQVRYVRIDADHANDHIRLTFTDNGIGVKTGDETAIFGKYFRGDNARSVFPEGTGLGLPFCKWIVERHGGSISLARPMKPTIFEVSLPLRGGQ